MRDRKKRNIIIGSLCCLLVFMATGYAFLRQVLNISGTANLIGGWKIRISDISVHEVVGTASNIEDKLVYTDAEATFGVNLIKPGDKIVYKVTVVNEGSVDAVLSIDSTISAHKDIKFTNTLTSGEILYGSARANGTTKLSQKEFYVTAEFNENATDIISGEISEYKIQLTYTQYDGNSFYEPPKDVETDNGVFQVSADGTILNYNADLGTHVNIPAEIDGIPITTISSDAFREDSVEYIYDFKVILNSSYQPQYGVVLREEIWQEAFEMAKLAGLAESDVYMIGDPDIPALQPGELEGYYYVENGITASPIFPDQTIKTTKKLKIKSLDLSNAINLEKIEDFAFSNADTTTTSKDIVEGLTSLTFGSNDKEITLGVGTFAGAKLNTLKVYSNLHAFIDFSGYGDEFPKELVSPFGMSKIGTLVIEPSSTNKEILPTQNSLKGYWGSFSCVDVDKLYIESGITSIPSLSFSGSVIDNINLPKSLTRIDSGAFIDVVTNDFVIPENVVDFSNENVSGDGSFEALKVNGTLTINSATALNGGIFSRIEANEVNIGSSVTKIGPSVFYGSTIGKVNIASSKTIIETEAFPSGTIINYLN